MPATGDPPLMLEGSPIAQKFNMNITNKSLSATMELWSGNNQFCPLAATIVSLALLEWEF